MFHLHLLAVYIDTHVRICYFGGRVLLIIENLCINRANLIVFNQKAPNYLNVCIEIAAIAGHTEAK